MNLKDATSSGYDFPFSIVRMLFHTSNVLTKIFSSVIGAEVLKRVWRAEQLLEHRTSYDL